MRSAEIFYSVSEPNKTLYWSKIVCQNGSLEAKHTQNISSSAQLEKEEHFERVKTAKEIPKPKGSSIG